MSLVGCCCTKASANVPPDEVPKAAMFSTSARCGPCCSRKVLSFPRWIHQVRSRMSSIGPSRRLTLGQRRWLGTTTIHPRERQSLTWGKETMRELPSMNAPPWTSITVFVSCVELVLFCAELTDGVLLRGSRIAFWKVNICCDNASLFLLIYSSQWCVERHFEYSSKLGLME